MSGQHPSGLDLEPPRRFRQLDETRNGNQMPALQRAGERVPGDDRGLPVMTWLGDHDAMAVRWTVDRLRTDLDRLAARGLQPSDYFDEVSLRVRRSIEFVGACWYTVDPSNTLITGHHQDGLPERLPELAHNEYVVEDVNKYAMLARRRRPVASLVDATRGRPERSPRYREVMRELDLGDELRSVFVCGRRPWGVASFTRPAGVLPFDVRDARGMASLTAIIGSGLRQSLIIGDARRSPSEETGVIVLRPPDVVDLVTPAARDLLSELGSRDVDPIPMALRSVAISAQARRRAAAKARTILGRWLCLEAQREAGGERVVVTLTPATPSQRASLYFDAYGLSARERDVVRQVAGGRSTAEIAEQLYVSPHTVIDHVNRVFDKTGTRSRRELVAKLFFEHHLEPAQAAGSVDTAGAVLSEDVLDS